MTAKTRRATRGGVGCGLPFTFGRHPARIGGLKDCAAEELARVQGGLEPMLDIRRSIAIVVSAGLLVLSGLVSRGVGDEPKSARAELHGLHDSFETPQVVWEREHTDTTINLIAQDRSVRAAHD